MVKRYAVLERLAARLTDELVAVTLGGTSIEWHSLGKRDQTMFVGGMGLVTPVGLGLALALPHRKVIVLDSEGSLLLNLSPLATLALEKPPNLFVLVIDNECYEYVGGPPSATSWGVDLAAMARGAGIPHASTVRSLDAFDRLLDDALPVKEFWFGVAKVAPGLTPVEGKTSDIFEDKYRFVRYIERTEGRRILTGPEADAKIPDPTRWNAP